MSSLFTLPNGDSAWLLRKAIERIMQQVSVLETNIGASTTANSSNTQIIFNDNGTLRGDAGLTYNATTDTLTVGNATITGDLTAARLIVTGATVPTNGMYLPTANTIAWAINSAEALRLNATGLGVGIIPSYKLDVQGADNSIIAQFGGVGGRKVHFTTSVNGGFANGFFNFVSTSSVGAFSFQNTSGTHLTIDSAGNVGIGVTPAGTGGCLQLKSGVTFPATQVASSDANTLDDYEEGTWTGTLVGATTNPTTPVTATGRYTKIGRQVFVEIHFNNVNTTGASGQIKVTGSPFTSNSSVGSTGSIMMSSIGSFTGSPVAFIGTSTTEIELYTSSSAAGIGFVNHNAGASRSLWISLTYTV
jgi:hypothetical protein